MTCQVRQGDTCTCRPSNPLSVNIVKNIASLFFFFFFFYSSPFSSLCPLFLADMAIWFARSRNLVSSLRHNLCLSTILIKRDYSPRPVFTASHLSSTVFLSPVASLRHESTAVEKQPDLVQHSDEEEPQVFLFGFFFNNHTSFTTHVLFIVVSFKLG